MGKEVVNYHGDMLVDSLYASKTAMGICRDNGWDYIIRYKAGSILSITEEYNSISEKDRSGNAEYINGIDYKGKMVNVLQFREDRMKKGRRCAISSNG